MREESALGCLTPCGGKIPAKERWPAIAGRLSEACGAPLSEVTYAWQDGQMSLELLFGPADRRRSAGGGALRLVSGGETVYPYVLYVPRGYDPGDPAKKWPLIFFFHGIGERGRDPAAVLRNGLPRYLAEGGGLDAIVVAPQCPEESHWADAPEELEKLRRFLPHMIETLPADRDRIYVTGLSMGGRCAWKLALAMPGIFAAMAVVCGRTESRDLQTIRDLPLWMFHGVEDGTTSFDNVERIFPRLLESGHRRGRLTVYPYGGHAIWEEVYGRASLYDWLLARSLSESRRI